MFRKFSVMLIVLVFSTLSFGASKTKVFFESPKDGATVSGDLKMKFSQKGLHVLPAGQNVDDKTSGHFHVLVDEDAFEEGKIIPSDATHVHYGKAQTAADLKLAPGEHKLTLQFADGLHRSYGKALSQTIHVTVK